MIHKVWSFCLGVAAVRSNCWDFLPTCFLFLSCGFQWSHPLRSTGKCSLQKVSTVSRVLNGFFNQKPLELLLLLIFFGVMFSELFFHYVTVLD